MLLFGFSAIVLGDLIGGSLDKEEGISDFFVIEAVLAGALVAGGSEEVDSDFLRALVEVGFLEVGEILDDVVDGLEVAVGVVVELLLELFTCS